MDDKLKQIENITSEIESLLNGNNVLEADSISKIRQLYSEKELLISSFVEYKESELGRKTYNENTNYWNERFKSYLEYDKSVLDKLKVKVDLQADLVKNFSVNKKLLIYSKA